MRALFLSPVVPHPLNSGTNQRIFHVLRAVATMSEVTFVFPSVSNYPETEAAPIRSLVKRVYSFPFASYALQQDLRLPTLVQSAKVKLRYCHPWEPALLQWVTSVDGRKIVAQLCEERFDLIWGEKLRALRLIPRWVDARVIIDLDDLEHRKLARHLCHTGLSPWIPLDVLEFLRLRAVERGLARLPYEFAVCSEADRQVLGGGPRIHVVPNGVEAPGARERSQQSLSSPLFVFVGDMSYPPNIDAVRFFARRTLSLIKRCLPRARFAIVGRNPDVTVWHLHNGADILVTGTVPSVEPYLRAATALVVPLRSGGGTRIKILEALAHYVPVVTSTIGAEGLDVQHGRHLLVADAPAEFAHACVRLCEAPALGERLAEAGIALVRDRYEWTLIEGRVKDIIARGIPLAPESLRNRVTPVLPGGL